MANKYELKPMNIEVNLDTYIYINEVKAKLKRQRTLAKAIEQIVQEHKEMKQQNQ